MSGFTLAIFCCVMLNDFIIKIFDLPGPLHFLPEAMSLVVILYVLVAGTRNRFELVAPKYWLLFFAMAVIMLCGIINGAPGAGPVLSGARFYLRAVPMFFLAAVQPPTEEQLKRQCRWLLALALLQVPIAVYQRWVVQSEQRATGDDVMGTLMDSGILSLFLIGAVAVLTGLALRRRIGPGRFAMLAFTLLIPTSINETKVTVFFVPLAIIVTVMVAAERGKRLRILGLAFAGMVAIGMLFVPVYNMTQRYNPFKTEKDIVGFFTDQKRFTRYLSSDVKGLGTTKDVRRGDAIVVPFQYLVNDPVKLMFGLGLGAASPSTLGKDFEGSYYRLFEKFLIVSFSFFLLEVGVLGIVLIGALFWLLFRDTLAVARRDRSFIGAFAAGWSGVVAIFTLDVVYTVFHEFTSVTYLFWYYSGVVCARRVALELGHETVAAGVAPAMRASRA